MPLWAWLIIAAVGMPVITAIGVVAWYCISVAGLFGRPIGRS